MNKIYFAASIRGGRNDVDTYFRLIELLRQHGTVLTEHVGDRKVSIFGEDGLTDPMIHDRDMEFLCQSNYLVAEVTTASLGVGYELGRIVERNQWVSFDDRKKILCLYRPQVDKRLSAMISGCSGIKTVEYQTIAEAKKAIDDFFA